MLIFANKQDLPNAMNASELTEKLGLQQLRNRRVSSDLSFINLRYILLPISLFFPQKTDETTFIFSGIFKQHVQLKATVCTRDLIGCQMNLPNLRRTLICVSFFHSEDFKKMIWNNYSYTYILIFFYRISFFSSE